MSERSSNSVGRNNDRCRYVDENVITVLVGSLVLRLLRRSYEIYLNKSQTE